MALVQTPTREEIKDAFFDIAEDKRQARMATHRVFTKLLGLSLVRRWLQQSWNSLLQTGTTNEMLKVDLRMAYDTVEWDFHSAVLHLFGFPDIFIDWIEECVTTPMFSVCINGNPHGFFKGSTGLRQGDPMSPFLFVLIIEVLQLMLQQLIDQNEGFSFHWRCKEIGYFQLCFADDLLFCTVDVVSVQILRYGLDEFAKLLDFMPTHKKVSSFYPGPHRQ
ncbi:hypothetical protein Sango_3108700 [Sesamum angolense]|uniref:Reverse transcriptase domain-containing protein n=1 Tax=Sesamum angolense TaxID=2727404 RepID=A0AAE1T9F8_9LAMI|nr:hypothetical protein Sango_3108700 [Sesamum angolense]